MDFVALDFETANSSRSSICQIGAVKFRNGVEVSQIQLLVQPEPFYMDAMNESVHGISIETLEKAPSFREVWDEELLGFLQGERIVCHNTSFDMYVLASALKIHGLAFPRFEYVCSLRLAKDLLIHQKQHKLNILAEAVLGCYFRHHDALEDARVCGLLYIYLYEHFDVTSHIAAKYQKGTFSAAGHQPFVLNRK